ncbi:TetR-like C-terminal domain-containing protein [Streptomyces silvensis]|uniref:TetR-like C-terminal domain-containing protein n=1 Tax=Streptomyces silvensis TaxID=1765722 RepID=UPI0007C70855|nr:TetR-like C-terminal domain-containing protein [Streptomyces silvensis]
MTSTEEQLEREAVLGRLKPAAMARLTERHRANLDPAAVAAEAGVDTQEAGKYFPDEDALLSALVLGSYRALADSTEAAAEAALAAGADPLRRWVAVWQGIREWAVAHPEEYVLLWGRPVPGYSAPPETMEAVARIVLAMVAVLRDAEKAGELTGDRPGEAPLTDGMSQNVDALAAGLLEGLPRSVMARMFVVWTQLHGMVGFEVNSHIMDIAPDPTAVFEYGAAAMGEYIGLRRPADG